MFACGFARAWVYGCVKRKGVRVCVCVCVCMFVRMDSVLCPSVCVYAPCSQHGWLPDFDCTAGECNWEVRVWVGVGVSRRLTGWLERGLGNGGRVGNLARMHEKEHARSVAALVLEQPSPRQGWLHLLRVYTYSPRSTCIILPLASCLASRISVPCSATSWAPNDLCRTRACSHIPIGTTPQICTSTKRCAPCGVFRGKAAGRRVGGRSVPPALLPPCMRAAVYRMHAMAAEVGGRAEVRCLHARV